MRSIYNFIVEPFEDRYENLVKVGDKSLIVNTSVENHSFVSKKAKVIELPLAYSTDIKIGDIVYVHHNLFRRWYDQKGRERNSSTYFKDNLYFCSLDQIYMYNSTANLDYCFIKPILDENSLDIKKEKDLFGIVKYSNKKLLDKGIKEGDLITFSPESEFEFLINGERLYCMKFNDIVIKHEHKGNEKEYNPSWATSSEGINKSSEGTDCRYGRGCDCGPTKERSCY